MTLKISHVLVDVDDLGVILLNLAHEAFDQTSEIWVVILDVGLVLLVMTPNVGKELLEMLRIIHDQFANDCLVEVNAWELVRVTFDYHCCHRGEML